MRVFALKNRCVYWKHRFLFMGKHTLIIFLFIFSVSQNSGMELPIIGSCNTRPQ